uniref:Uncharacterized protein n=1 Tax=Terrapene triunguis TaxID=2587831 RepID=A0A674JA74_9SAUR
IPLLLLLLLQVAEAPPASVSAEKSLVWNPGPEAELMMPVSYFYIQAVRAAGQNFTRSSPPSPALCTHLLFSPVPDCGFCSSGCDLSRKPGSGGSGAEKTASPNNTRMFKHIKSHSVISSPTTLKSYITLLLTSVFPCNPASSLQFPK